MDTYIKIGIINVIRNEVLKYLNIVMAFAVAQRQTVGRSVVQPALTLFSLSFSLYHIVH